MKKQHQLPSFTSQFLPSRRQKILPGHDTHAGLLLGNPGHSPYFHFIKTSNFHLPLRKSGTLTKFPS